MCDAQTLSAASTGIQLDRSGEQWPCRTVTSVLEFSPAVVTARALGISFGDSLPDEDPFRLVADRGIQIQAADTVEEEDGVLVTESV